MKKPATAQAATGVLNHDNFRSNRPRVINVIDSNKLERDAGGKPVTLFLNPL
ncbi:hypothetical protein GHK62_16920 [Sinorhizobium terangae]|uniref:Uncharacterized protein n=1 Tax=Sinorhizobium terangae TaxID=110322 RepID=A0A6N7LGG5_SINTE|nr:hypothetical protein [Sinorhizobium terangae]